jgi:hypothetical protein
LGGDLYRIEAADPHSDDCDATVDRKVREQNNNARPGIANPRTSISDGLAIRGEEVQSAQSEAEQWLRRIRLRT